MPTYTNKDLERKPLTSSISKVYNNKSLPEDKHPPDVLDDGTVHEEASPPDVLDDVEDEVETPVVNERKVTPLSGEEPDSWLGGFTNSLMNGEALKVGMEGLKGYLPGATTDIPSTIMDGLRSVGNTIAGKFMGDSSGLDLNSQGEGIDISQAGTPEGAQTFGRDMGRMTGQPLATYGMTKAAPGMVRTAGYPTELAGSIMKKYAPMSGMIPKMAEPRIMRTMERGVGKGIEAVGQRMKNVGKIRVVDGKIEGPVSAPLEEGQSITPDAELSYRRPLADGEDIAPKMKPKVRLLPDGNFVNLETGEMIDPQGNVLGAKSMPKIDRDSPFFKKNR